MPTNKQAKPKPVPPKSMQFQGINAEYFGHGWKSPKRKKPQ